MKPASRMQQALPYMIVLIALAARLLPGARTIDDAYITFRYARNLLAGEGLVYNPGEAVLGTTTPLYAGLMAFAGSLIGGVDAPFPQVAMVVNALADAGLCLLLLRLGRKTELEVPGTAAALVWAVLPFSVTFAIGGLETSVFVLLLTGVITAHMEGRRAAAAFLAALSLLARPDSALLLAFTGLDRVYLAFNQKARISLREIAAFALPLLAWLVPAAVFYGSPVPNSIAAKVSAYDLPTLAAFSRLLQHYATPFMDHLTFGRVGIATGMVLYFFLNAVGGLRLVRTQPRLWSWVVFPWVWFTVYAIANPLIFRWYLTPPLPAYIFTVLCGLEFIRRDLQASRLARISKPLAAVILTAPMLLALRGWTLQPDHGPSRPAPEMAWILLELKYQEAADFLLPLFVETAGDPVLAAGDIGALGYYTDARILDTLGLISPEAVPYYPTRPEFYVNAYAVAPELVNDLRPDFIVLLEVYGREGLFKDPEFLETYRLIQMLETDIYDSEGMQIYRIRSEP